MNCQRVNELMELLHAAWNQDADLTLLQLLKKLAVQAGYEGELTDLNDEILIYHLKMRNEKQHKAIPGLKKDYEDDFKTALLRARGILKD